MDRNPTKDQIAFKINCCARGCVYKIECVECREGVVKLFCIMTDKIKYERMKGHIRKINEKDEG